LFAIRRHAASGEDYLNLQKYLMVGLGGFAGAIARYWVGGFITQRVGLRFPYGTFVINITGCFLIGFLMHLLMQRGGMNMNWLYIVVIGFIGAYTTFSTFAYESLRAFQEGQAGIALIYIGLSVMTGLIAVWLG
jgi:CrcB protein